MTTRSTGSQRHAVDLADHDLGHAEAELVALAAHRLGQDGEHQLTAAVDE